MRLTKKYRIWWNANKELLTDPENEYNNGSVTLADESTAGIDGFYESDVIQDVDSKINTEGLIHKGSEE